MEDMLHPTREDDGLRATRFVIPDVRWDDRQAETLSPEQLLLYRSNLLGSDLTVTNFGGGNTSAKLAAEDPLSGEKVTVLWVKGSGGDIGSMDLGGFATLYLDTLLGLEKLYRGDAYEDEMVGRLPYCTYDLNQRAASIDTPLHGYLPFAHVDHVHPDAITALAASSTGEAVTQDIWGGAVGWLPWRRPGFQLGLDLRDLLKAQPDLRGAILAGHGLICWGETSKDCYLNTIDLIASAAKFLNVKFEDIPAFGGQKLQSRPAVERSAIAAKLMPALRGLMGGARPKVGHFSDNAEALEFVCSKRFDHLAPIGTSCPDHFLRTKIAPLQLDPARLDDAAYMASSLEAYREGYKAYYERNAKPVDPAMRDANPVVVLVPGVGCFTFAANKTTARLAAEFYANAINVMRGAEVIGDYLGLPEDEAFAIEYWALEEAKLKRMPPPKPLAGKVALVTGAAGAIGAAAARALVSDGACVMLTDRDAEALDGAEQALKTLVGDDLVASTVCDVTDEADIEAAFDACARAFGGLDILVANAGLASAASLEDTTLSVWNRNYDVLAKGYFLTVRAAFPLMKQQGGGSVIFIGSKNALAATANASAYASAKAAALHLARCAALEGAEYGIRVNVVNPDAVIRGSRIWDGAWRKERAANYGLDAGEELEDFYRNRSLLKRSVLPEDVAEAIRFFASEASSKSTGNVINVDAGNAQAFTR